MGKLFLILILYVYKDRRSKRLSDSGTEKYWTSDQETWVRD